MRPVVLIGLLALSLPPSAACQESRGAESRPESAPAHRIFKPRTEGKGQLLVRLDRRPCYGRCPVYTLTVTDDGVVSYSGKEHVAVRGDGKWWIDARRFDLLMHVITGARVHDLLHRYTYAEWTDASSAILTINVDGRVKTIE